MIFFFCRNPWMRASSQNSPAKFLRLSSERGLSNTLPSDHRTKPIFRKRLDRNEEREASLFNKPGQIVTLISVKRSQPWMFDEIVEPCARWGNSRGSLQPRCSFETSPGFIKRHVSSIFTAARITSSRTMRRGSWLLAGIRNPNYEFWMAGQRPVRRRAVRNYNSNSKASVAPVWETRSRHWRKVARGKGLQGDIPGE